MLFFAKAKQVGGVADLGFDLLLAVAEIVVGDDGDDNPAFVTAGQFESQAVIVEFALLFPAHAVAALTLGGVLPDAAAQLFLGELRQVRRQDDAASVAGPVFRIQSGIIFRKKRVAGVSEDAFDKIEVADEAARRQESDLHRFFRGESRHFRTNDRPQQQRHETLCLFFLCGGELADASAPVAE